MIFSQPGFPPTWEQNGGPTPLAHTFLNISKAPQPPACPSIVPDLRDDGGFPALTLVPKNKNLFIYGLSGGLSHLKQVRRRKLIQFLDFFTLFLY